MKRAIQKLSLTIVILTTIIFIPGCNKQQFFSDGNGTGILKGTIDIGPLCPVETVPSDPGCLPTPETYKAYPVGIWTSNGKQKITTISPESDGSYNVQLPEGNYLIAREKVQDGIGGSNLPATVLVRSGESTLLDINIDTGIR